MSEIALIGDIAFNGIISSEPESNGERFSKIVQFLNSSDLLVFANLETPVKVGEERNEYKKNIHSADPLVTENLLKGFNISCVALANNHIYDCKMSGLKATIDILDRLNIAHTGAGWIPEHCDPVIVDKNNTRVGFIAYVDKNTNPKTEYFQEIYINYFNSEKAREDIKSLKAEVDIVICSIHWGVDYSYYPTPEQVTTARNLVDAGADIIMGHHTHTFQPFEKYKGSYIFYSLGSLTFGDYIREGKTEFQALFRKTKKSAIVKLDYDRTYLKFIPTRELIGNYVVIDKRNYEKWSQRKWLHYRISNSSGIIKLYYELYEKVIYRVYEYFFGYYKRPLKRLFEFSNLRKIKKLLLIFL
jgi:hypothetical protein